MALPYRVGLYVAIFFAFNGKKGFPLQSLTQFTINSQIHVIARRHDEAIC